MVKEEDMKFLNKIFIVSVLTCLLPPVLYALSYNSPNYTLFQAKIVISGGKAYSANYFLNDVEIGRIFGGKAQSENYSLEAIPRYRRIAPLAPQVNLPITPTNISTQTLRGTKQKGTSIYINGYEVVPLSHEILWSCNRFLFEGENVLFITARNKYGLESSAVQVTIVLDTIPPFITIDRPTDGAMVYESTITVEGFIDEIPFSEERSLDFGLNLITIEASDKAGNRSSKSVEAYRARAPLPLPQ